MKFPKLDLVCSNDDLRPVMGCVRVEKEFTYATDAHIIVRHKTSEIFNPLFVETIPGEGINIPSRAIALMRKIATKNIALTDDKKQIQLFQVDDSIITYRLNTDNYPKSESLWPDKKDCKPLAEIGLNAKKLNQLSEGLHSNFGILHLWFFEPTKAILCDTNGNGDYFSAIGLIMPVMMNI